MQKALAAIKIKAFAVLAKLRHPARATTDIAELIAKAAMYTLQLTPIGDSVGILFPEELLARLQLKAGDAIYLTETPDGHAFTKHNPEFEEQVRVGREIMKEHRAVLQELSKGVGADAAEWN